MSRKRTLQRKVSRKLRKTNKNVKKNNKTRKNLKGGSGRGNSGNSGKGKGKGRMTQEEIKKDLKKQEKELKKQEEEFARLANEANKLAQQLANVKPFNPASVAELDAELEALMTSNTGSVKSNTSSIKSNTSSIKSNTSSIKSNSSNKLQEELNLLLEEGLSSGRSSISGRSSSGRSSSGRSSSGRSSSSSSRNYNGLPTTEECKKANKGKGSGCTVSGGMRGGALTLEEHNQNKKLLLNAGEKLKKFQSLLLKTRVLIMNKQLEINKISSTISKLSSEITKLNQMKKIEKDKVKINNIVILIDKKKSSINDLKTNIEDLETSKKNFESRIPQIEGKKTELEKIIESRLEKVRKGNILFPRATIKGSSNRHNTSKTASAARNTLLNDNFRNLVEWGTQKPPSSAAGPARNGSSIGDSVTGKKEKEPNTSNLEYKRKVNNIEKRLAAL